MDESAATIQTRILLERVRRLEPGAIPALIEHVHPRLCKLAAQILNVSFSQLKPLREVDSVVSETYLRLARALETVDLPTPADFFRFAAHKIRQTLLDMVAEWRAGQQGQAGTPAPDGLPPGRRPPVRIGPADGSASDAGFDQPDDTLTVTTKAMWAEFHRQVEQLPERVREVFILHYYLELPQSEIAEMLAEHPKEVSRQWLKALILLKPYIPEGR